MGTQKLFWTNTSFFSTQTKKKRPFFSSKKFFRRFLDKHLFFQKIVTNKISTLFTKHFFRPKSNIFNHIFFDQKMCFFYTYFSVHEALEIRFLEFFGDFSRIFILEFLLY